MIYSVYIIYIIHIHICIYIKYCISMMILKGASFLLEAEGTGDYFFGVQG